VASNFFLSNETVTLAIAVLGAVLGVLNAWRNWLQDRVRVKVFPFLGKDQANQFFGAVEVRNLSSFPITIREFGFDSYRARGVMRVIDPEIEGGGKLPVRVESRACCTALVSIAANVKPLSHARFAVVRTACGKTFRGHTGAFREIQEIASAAIAEEHAEASHVQR
jgi:hypothetical protein